MSWHDRPVLAPLIYMVSSTVSGGMGFAAGYLVMNSIRYGLYGLLFMDTLLMLYLVESHRVARRDGDDSRVAAHPPE